MTARRDSVDEPEAGSSAGRALLIGTVVFAAAATGLLVLADDMRWLRLGIVAALWAALVGAFLAAKYRRQLSDQKDVLADRQELYELELEREIAARREYELEAVAEAKRVAEEESRDDIAALRGELQSLRTTLESLLGGEFLVERYALRAESTRMRSLSDDRQLKRLPAAMAKDEIPSVVREAETELIERIREVHQPPRREPQPRPAAVSQPLPKPQQRPDRPAPEPSKPVKRAEPVAQARRVEPPPHPAEMSDRWFIPGALDENGAPRRKPAPAPQPAYDKWEPELSEIEEEWTPSWEAANQPRRHEQPEPPRPEPAQPGGHARPDNGRYAAPTPTADSGRRARQDVAPPVAADNGRAAQPADSGRRARPVPADSGQYVVPPAAALGRRGRPDPADSGQVAGPAVPADVGRRARQVPADSGQYAVPPAAADLGRRARQDPADTGQYVAPPAAADLGRGAQQVPADTGQYVVPPAGDLGRRGRPDPADSGQVAMPPVPADLGRRARQDPAESGQFAMPAVPADLGRRAHLDPAESGQFAMPPAAADLGRRARLDPAESGQFAMPAVPADLGRRAHLDPAESGQFAVPPADLGRRARQDPADAGRYAPAADSGRRRQDPADSDRTTTPPAVADNGRFAQPADGGRYAVPGAADPGRRARQDPTDSARRAHQETEVAMRPAEPPAPTHDTSKPVGHQSEQTSWLAQYNQPKPPSSDRDPLDYRARPYRTHAADSGQFPVVDDLPPSGRRHARTEPEGDAGGGRRRRAEGQPTWQETQSGNRNGHSRPEPVEEPSGSHAAGRSVNELLANHGLEAGPRRRRRREE